MTTALTDRTKNQVEPDAPGSFRGVDPARPVPVLTSLLELWNWRGLVRLMVFRDFLGRYKGSLLGALWPLVSPLGHMLLYTFLFSIILKVRFGTEGSTANFALYLMCGLLPWQAFSEAVSRSTVNILESPNLVKKVVFPLEILPLSLVVSAVLSTCVTFSLLLILATICQGQVHPTVLFLPLVAFSQILLMAGFAWFLAAMGVFIRDFQHIIALGLSAWMYATPIVYPTNMLPENLRFLLWINPMAGIVGDYRRVILEGLPPDWSMYAVYTAVALCVCFLGFAFFVKTKRSFADII